jgi:hypothetical protein
LDENLYDKEGTKPNGEKKSVSPDLCTGTKCLPWATTAPTGSATMMRDKGIELRS